VTSTVTLLVALWSRHWKSAVPLLPVVKVAEGPVPAWLGASHV
jgi:hypothetical protein